MKTFAHFAWQDQSVYQRRVDTYILLYFYPYDS